MEGTKLVSVEVCATSIMSAIAANQAGAQRIELCDNIAEGGTTPSAGTIAYAIEKLNVETWVMIRPRGGDFLYSDDEFKMMLGEILISKNIGAHGIVTGMLIADGRIDFMRMIELIEIAKPLKVAFHRAFDMVINPFMALEELIDLGVCRILTSGQKNTAIEGKELIKDLVTAAKGRIEIMAGSGVNPGNAIEIISETGVSDIHLSGSHIVQSAMEFKQKDVILNSWGHKEDFTWKETDPEIIKEIINSINQK